MDSPHHWQAHDDAPAIRFTGNWREYLPIAATNVALMIVTLGVYRFWAKARERRYLWSRTQVIDAFKTCSEAAAGMPTTKLMRFPIGSIPQGLTPTN